MKSSNWGIHTVHVAAPGKDIWSTLPGGSFGSMSGTSQATAIVSAAVAVMASQEKPNTSEALIAKVVSKGKIRSELLDRTRLGILIEPENSILFAKDWLKLIPRS